MPNSVRCRMYPACVSVDVLSLDICSLVERKRRASRGEKHQSLMHELLQKATDFKLGLSTFTQVLHAALSSKKLPISS